MPRPAGFTIRTHVLDEVRLEDAGTILDRLERSTAAMRTAQFRIMGGAVTRTPPSDSAFAHQERGMVFNVAALCEDPV